MTVLLTIAGTPSPKGSRTVGKRRDGSIYTRPASRGEGAWTEAVAMEAMAARARGETVTPPFAVEVVFKMPRPAQPKHEHPTRGDLDKLVRSTLDGLVRGRLLSDDRHVVYLIASKGWAEPGREGATLRVTKA